LDKFSKFKFIFALFFGFLFLLMWIANTIGVDGTVGKALMQVIRVILYICTAILAIIVGIWFIMKGKPYRDKVVGPNPTGVDFLRKLCESAEDPEEKKNGLSALQLMLMGQEPEVSGKEFLRMRATKFYEKVPEAMEALNTLEHIFILQQAGKDAAMEREFDVKIPWPGVEDVWPPSKYKLTEARKTVTIKFKAFFFRASVHPWMKKYAQESGNKHDLLESVEVPLAMIKNNEEEFDALDKLYKGFRPDPAGLKPLQEVVDRLLHLDKHGADPSTLQQALKSHYRTGGVKEVFDSLDEDESGYLDKDEFSKVVAILSDAVGFVMTDFEMTVAFEDMDVDRNNEVQFEEFKEWWEKVAVSKKDQKLVQMQQMEAAGLLEASPKPKELETTLKVITRLLPTIGLRLRCFEVLEEMCPDDKTYDCLQECFNLCELKRVMLNDKLARGAVVGLEAMCMVPQLLKGNKQLHIEPNPEALAILEKVKTGDKACVAALAYLKQPEYRRVWGMMTQRQRRLFILICGVAAYPVMAYSGILDGAPPLDLGDLIGNITMIPIGDSGSFADDEGEEEVQMEESSWVDPDAGRQGTLAERNNPSYYVLGLLPLASSVFVNLFGQRIASLITLATVFVASAGTTIAAAMNDGSDDWTPTKVVGVGMGVYTGSVATKVATGNIKFAYGVQGATVGAIVSRFATFIWRPKLLWLVPELIDYMDWVDLTVAGMFGGAAAWISNTYRGIISIFATSAIGTFGFVQVASGYGIPGIDNFTLDKLMAGGVACDATDTSCWISLGFVMIMAVGGTVNQFKMETIDFSLPAVTSYEVLMHKIDKAMTLLFAINEFIEGGVNLSTDDLMERCLQARDQLVNYMNVLTNLMHFGLCFGFAADCETSASFDPPHHCASHMYCSTIASRTALLSDSDGCMVLCFW
jgi:hypothetical protein